MPSVASWLANLGLEKYVEAFTASEIDFDTLRHLREEDLKELGLPIGPRRKVLAAIAALKDTAMSPAGSGSAPTSAPLRSAERRQLTVMFIDLVGSTELSQRVDPEDMQDIIGAYQSAVSAEITKYEGHVAKFMGDGVLAYFGWPQAHEYDAERAVRAGLAAISSIALLRTPQGEPLAARIGIATGLVVVGDLVGNGTAQEEAVFGKTPNLAARLQTLAEPNTVVIADSTQRLVSGLFNVVDLGHRTLKGFTTEVRIWRIVREVETEGRFDALHGVALTPLAGRLEELGFLLQRWQQARAGEGQVVLLSGEPGIGKSRLIAALNERLRAEPHISLRYFCSPYYRNTPLYPVIKQLERAAGLAHDDSTDTKLDKLEALLSQAVSEMAEAGPLLAALLSIDTAGRYPPVKLIAQAQKARSQSSLVQLLKGLAARKPVLMLVEDAHWMDPTTYEWLDIVVDALQHLPAFLIVTFRPDFQPRWTRFSHVAALSLSRLDRNQAAEMVDRMVGGKSLPLEVTKQILAKTEGVPLFIEELTKTVLESGLLIGSGDHYELSGPLPPLAIPSTLQDSLMARLDRLASVKEVAQIGACFGRVFDYRVLAAVTSSDELQLESALEQLERSELVFRRGVPPEATYTFKHALVQDTAYQSLLKSRRQRIHATIASTLGAQFTDIAEVEPETLAHHYTAAGLTDQAVAYWLKAGQQALKRSANLEAMVHLSKGLELIESLPDSEDRLRQEIQLQTALAVAAMAVRGWGSPEVLRACSRARMLSEKLGDNTQLFVALCGEASHQMISGNLRAADEIGHQCLELARVARDPALLLEAHHRQWGTKFYMGDYAAAEAHANFGISTYDPDRHHSLTYIYTGHDPGVCCRTFAALMLWLRGYPDQAVERCQDALALAERTSHALSIVQAQSTFSSVYLMRREPNEVRRWAEKWVALSKDFGFLRYISEGTFQLGCALAEEGQAHEGVREMREGIAAFTATGAAHGLPYLLGLLGWACGECGEASEGLAVLEKALGIVAESGANYQLPELLRIKGELLLLLDPRDIAAGDLIRQAVAAARCEGTKSLELRAALSLSRLYRAQGRNREARDVLYPVYTWFTEGLETRDVVESKELLGELN